MFKRKELLIFKQYMKDLERGKHRLIAAIAIYVDPVLREAALFLYNMTATTASIKYEDLLFKMKECTEVCQHFRKELELYESQDDADGDTSPITDVHLNWLLQKRSSRRISQLTEEKLPLVPGKRDSLVLCGTNPIERKDKPFMPASDGQSVLRNTDASYESTSLVPEERRHITIIQVGNASSIGTKYSHAEQSHVKKCPIKTESSPEALSEERLALVVKENVWPRTKNDDVPTMRHSKSTATLTRERHLQHAREKGVSTFVEEGDSEIPTQKEDIFSSLYLMGYKIPGDRNASLEKENIFPSAKKHSFTTHANKGVPNSREAMIFKERLLMSDAIPSETFTGEKDSSTLREISPVETENLLRVSILPEDTKADTPMKEQMSCFRGENSQGSFTEQIDSFTLGELFSIPIDNFSTGEPLTPESSSPVILRDKKISLLREENPSGMSVEERDSVVSEEIFFKRNVENFPGVPVTPQSSNSVILRDKKISRLREENPSGASTEDRDSVTSRAIFFEGKIITPSEVPSTLQSSNSVILRDKKMSRLREENPSGASIEERDSVISGEILLKRRIENPSRVSRMLQCSNSVILRDKKISWMREENPSGISTEYRDSVISWKNSLESRKQNPFVVPSALQSVNSVILRDRKISRMREENPSGASTEERDSITLREDSSLRQEIHFEGSYFTRDLNPVDPQEIESNVSHC